jgi:hypothetical protein
MAERKQAVGYIVTAGIAFLLGYLLAPKKVARASTVSAVRLEDLLIDPPQGYPGDEIRISCLATNLGNEPGYFPIICQADNQLLDQEVYLEPNVPKEVVFIYTPTGAVSWVPNHAPVSQPVSISVGDLFDYFYLWTVGG